MSGVLDGVTDLEASTLTIAGSVVIASAMTCGSIVSSGGVKAGTNVAAAELSLTGSLVAASLVTGPTFKAVVGSAIDTSGGITFSGNGYFYGYDGAAWLPLGSGWA